MKHFPKKENHLTILGICYTWRGCSYLQVLPVGTYEPNTALHNDAKSPSRVHFWDLCNIYDFNPFLGFFMLGDTKTTTKVMLIIIYYPFPNVKFENG